MDHRTFRSILVTIGTLSGLLGGAVLGTIGTTRFRASSWVRVIRQETGEPGSDSIGEEVRNFLEDLTRQSGSANRNAFMPSAWPGTPREGWINIRYYSAASVGEYPQCGIEVVHSDPARAIRTANDLAEAAVRGWPEAVDTRIRVRREEHQGQLNRARNELAEAAIAEERFRGENPEVKFLDNPQEMVECAVRLQEERREAEQGVRRLEERIETLQKSLDAHSQVTAPPTVDGNNDPEVRDLRATLVGLRAELASLRGRYTDSSRRVTTKQSQIEETEMLLQNRLETLALEALDHSEQQRIALGNEIQTRETELKQARERLNQARNAIQVAQDEADRTRDILPSLRQQLDAAVRRRELAAQNLGELEHRLSARPTQHLELGAPAETPRREPSAGGWIGGGIGGVAGFALTFLLAAFRYRFLAGFSSPEEAEYRLRVPVLGRFTKPH